MAGPLDFLSGNNSTAYSDYANNQRQQANKYNQPISQGFDAWSQALDAYSQNLKTPDQLQNDLAANYIPSAYTQTQQKYLTQALNNNSAATGNLGSGYANYQQGSMVDDLLLNGMNSYIDRGMSNYNNSLAGLNSGGAIGMNALNTQTGVMTDANQADLQQQINNSQATTNAITGLVNMGAGFATGGAGGINTLIGQMGKSAMPGFTKQFQNGSDMTIKQAIETLKKQGLI
jgi:hypothetical protein